MSTSKFPPVALGAFAIAIGFAGVVVVNLIGEALLKAIFPEAISELGMPGSLVSQFAYQVMLFIAGMTGAWLIVNFAKSAAWILVWIFGILALFIDLYLGMTKFSDLPSWFRIVMLIAIPFQLWVGVKIGFYFKRST